MSTKPILFNTEMVKAILDGRKSKNNPSLTKEQIWNIHMDVVAKGNFTRIKNLIVKQLIKEFGDYYEEG